MAKRHVYVESLGFAEGLRWHHDVLWFSDLATGLVHRVDRAGSLETVCSVPGMPSGLGWSPDGALLVVSMNERAVFRWTGSELVSHADLRPHAQADMNDMIVDYEGRCYVTGFGYDAATEQPRPVGIVLVQPDGTAQVIDPPLFRPNGCALSEDGRFLWVAETRLHRVTRFAVHPDGTLHSPVVVADLGSGAWADGICLDAEHGLWIGDPKRRRCVRVGSDGVVTDSIDTAPYEAVTCVLGGPERRTLLIALSRFDTFTAMARSRRGRIDAVEVAVPGAGLP